MKRITIANLENLLTLINEAAGQNPEAWTKDEAGQYRANVGTYVLDWAYGAVRLSQMANESGGERDITGRGTKRETYHRMHAFLGGLTMRTFLTDIEATNNN
jgi:hypothetical protein